MVKSLVRSLTQIDNLSKPNTIILIHTVDEGKYLNECRQRHPQNGGGDEPDLGIKICPPDKQ